MVQATLRVYVPERKPIATRTASAIAGFDARYWNFTKETWRSRLNLRSVIIAANNGVEGTFLALSVFPDRCCVGTDR